MSGPQVTEDLVTAGTGGEGGGGAHRLSDHRDGRRAHYRRGRPGTRRPQSVLLLPAGRAPRRPRPPAQHPPRWPASILAVLGALAGYLVARRLLAPLRRASKATVLMSKGDLDIRLPAGQDEFGVLSASFNRMAENLQAKMQDLEAGQARERRFVADVAHELRTPVSALVGEASLLKSAHGERIEWLPTGRQPSGRDGQHRHRAAATIGGRPARDQQVGRPISRHLHRTGLSGGSSDPLGGAPTGGRPRWG